MKHLFVIETADDVLLPPDDIDDLTLQFGAAVEGRVGGREVFARSICNQPSAIRGIYRLYLADQTKSPDELGSAK